MTMDMQLGQKPHTAVAIQGWFVAYGPSFHCGEDTILKFHLCSKHFLFFFPLEKKMSEFSTRGQRVKASWLYANAEKAAAVFNGIDTYGLILCIDKEEQVL